MYMYHVISIFNLICIFLVKFKHMITSFKFLFFLFKTHFLNQVYFFLITIIVKTLCAYIASLTYCVSFSRISYTALLIMALFSSCLLIFPWYGMITMVFSRLNSSVLGTNVYQDLTFTRRISRAVNEISF